ncbi:hypothetical protein [Rheinheimera soli]|uniref:Uncharacterized protein n=1 Tax=Rheinheimera soli TaxID=443616 RepID=A0ABU1W1Y2_9GAMM|nr:hypothetical protein [Rheinheimera soli]MDR7121979.1 hypothetical protein [Rheinheimera soli]
MPKETYLFLGALVTALIGIFVARYTSGVQLKIAKDNSEKDIRLQADRLADERLKNEVALERDKLEKLHKILSVISFENSQTMSYIQSSETELSDFRKRYIENCDRLHDALAITDLYYPDMSEPIRQIFGQANCFWGYQEGVIRIDIKTNEQGWQSNMLKVLDAGGVINKHVKSLQYQISERGKELSKAFQRTSR